MQLHTPVLDFAEIKNLIDKAQKNMYILLHQLQQLVRLFTDRAVGKKLVYGVCNQGQRRTEIVGNVGEEYQFGMRGGLQFTREPFQLVFLLFQLVSLLFQLFLPKGKLTVQPILRTQGKINGNQQSHDQQKHQQAAIQNYLLRGIACQILIDFSVQGFNLLIE